MEPLLCAKGFLIYYAKEFLILRKGIPYTTLKEFPQGQEFRFGLFRGGGLLTRAGVYNRIALRLFRCADS